MSEARRNIVMVTMDSLRADHCSFMGYGRETTPTLDELAATGLSFENAVAAGVPTIASMTAVMTGDFSYASPEIGFDAEQRRQVTSRRSVAELLSTAGYSTGALSPNPPASSYFGFDDGFDWFEDFLNEQHGSTRRIWNRVVERSLKGGGVSTYLRLARNVLKREEVLRPWDDYYDRLLEWRAEVSEPYFLWVLLLEPHHPWLPPKEHQVWSTRSDVYRSFRYYWEMLNSDWQPDFSPRDRQRLINLYDDSIRHGDRFLERLLDDLREDDPVCIVHADHGEEFGEHGRYGHQPFLTENLIHVPMVIANIDQDRSIERPVSLRGLAPTIADLANVPHRFPSRSLLEAGRNPWSVSKVFAAGDRRLALRSPDLKYVRDGPHHQLHDLRVDPDEQVDLSDRRPEVVSALDEIVGQHVAGERERRAIDRAAEELEFT